MSAVPSAGLLVRLWLEPGAEPHAAVRARLLSVHGADVGDELVSSGDEAEVAGAVLAWLRRECSTLRDAGTP